MATRHCSYGVADSTGNLKNMKGNKIAPVSPVAPWLGGKSRLAETIIELIEGIDHVTYAEPFVGMGGVFLRRSILSKAEVINDYSRDVSNFFRVLQRHYVAFMEMMRFQITTRAEFERLLKTDPNTLTDMERAARFLYLQRTAFGGKSTGRCFGVSPETSARFDVTKLGSMLEDLHSRLAGVVIENLSYEKFIQRYDRPKTLFYLDPPYFGCENDYGKGLFDRNDFQKIAEQLLEISGKFILSINDVPEIRNVFSSFHIKPVQTKYSITTNGVIDASELLISNVDFNQIQKRQGALF